MSRRDFVWGDYVEQGLCPGIYSEGSYQGVFCPTKFLGDFDREGFCPGGIMSGRDYVQEVLCPGGIVSVLHIISK